MCSVKSSRIVVIPHNRDTDIQAMITINTLIADFDEKYRTGISQLDQDFQKGLLLLKETIQATDEQLPALLNKLLEHYQLQFFEEEAVFTAYDTPRVERHFHEHQTALGILSECVENANAERCDSARDALTSEFSQWLARYFHEYQRVAVPEA